MASNHKDPDRPTIPIDKIRPQRDNANKHTERGMGALENSVQKDGWIGAITVAADLETFDGSARIEKAGSTGFDEAIIVESDGTRPVVVVRKDIPNAQDPRAVRLGIAANRVAQLNLQWEGAVLEQTFSEGLLGSLFTEQEVQDLLKGSYAPDTEVDGEGEAGDSFDETPEEGETRVKPGDLWRLGPHRLVCGDGRFFTNLRLLMGDDKADMVFTDPPYGVSYDRARGDYQHTIENDDLRGEKLHEFLVAAFGAADQCLKPGGAIYVFHGDGSHGTRYVFEGAFAEAGWYLSATLIWAKNAAGYGFADYRAKHEPILYGWKEGAEHYFTPDRTQTTLWDFDRDNPQSYVHPTQKPLAIVEKAIHNSSRRNEIVLDQFAGGGPVVIACHRTERIARVMDIDPHFCDVILRRAELEGIQPIQRLHPLP